MNFIGALTHGKLTGKSVDTKMITLKKIHVLFIVNLSLSKTVSVSILFEHMITNY